MRSPAIRNRTLAMLCVAVAALGMLSGCHKSSREFQTSRAFPWRMPSWRRPANVLPPNVSMNEVVTHLNGRVANLQAWRSTDVRVKSPQGLPMSVGGMIAVENPRNFRLTLSAMNNTEADVGSNQEHLWMFVRRSVPQQVVLVRHDQIELAQRNLPIPFHPDWLMQALGVSPIDPTGMILERDPRDERVARLIAQHTSPSGVSVSKEIVVDTDRGIILAHELYDSTHQLVARANLDDYREQPLPDGGEILLPHQVELEWPPQEMAMIMSIGDIDVNPSHMPEQMWTMADYGGAPVVQLPPPSAVRVADVPPEMRRSRPTEEPVYTVPASANDGFVPFGQ